jgi:hypothetical protein
MGIPLSKILDPLLGWNVEAIPNMDWCVSNLADPLPRKQDICVLYIKPVGTVNSYGL